MGFSDRSSQSSNAPLSCLPDTHGLRLLDFFCFTRLSLFWPPHTCPVYPFTHAIRPSPAADVRPRASLAYLASSHLLTCLLARSLISFVSLTFTVTLSRSLHTRSSSSLLDSDFGLCYSSQTRTFLRTYVT